MNRLFAIGDIHGCLYELRKMVEEKIIPAPDDRIILIGDYIDRGPDSRGVVDYILDLKIKGTDLVALRGNHEVMLLNALETGEMTSWRYNGANSTLRSFKIKSISELDEKYLKFFNELLWYYQFEEYLFVHAGFSNSDPFNDRNEMVWTRNELYTNALLSGKIIIHGHTPITTEQCRRNLASERKVINIDTGCVYTDPGYGILTAIELYTKTLLFA